MDVPYRSIYLPSWALFAQMARRMNVCPFLLLEDDVFEIWGVGFVGFDAVGAECVDADAFMGVIDIPKGLGWGFK
jgi:hypothetical protein